MLEMTKGKPPREICTIANVQSSLNLLNSELHFLDIPHVSFNKTEPLSSLAQIVNVCFELAAVIKRNNLRSNQQFEDLLRAKSTLTRVHQEKDRIKTQLSNESNKVEDLKVKVNSAESRLAELTTQSKSLKQDVAQLQHTLSAQKLRHEHEIRRKDAIIASLKSKIHLSLTNKTSIPVKTKDHKNVILAEQYDEILDKYVCQLHNNIQLLLEESFNYRHLVESMYNRLSVELIACPDATCVNLSGLPCNLVVKTVKNNFDMFTKKFLGDGCLV